MAARCGGCHVADGNAFDLLDYDATARLGSELIATVEAGVMPPWGATGTEACTPRATWLDDLRLTDDELDLLRQWTDGGLSEGDPDEAAPLAVPDPPALDGVTDTLLGSTYSLTGDEEEYVCTVFDPALEGTTWLTGLALDTNHPGAVHHALWFLERNGEALANADAGEPYACFGATGRFAVEILGGMLPGTPVVTYPDGSGLQLEPGDVIVQQVHYDAGEPLDVLTGVELRTTTSRPALNAGIVEISESGNPDDLQEGPGDDAGPEFRIPAGTEGHTETYRWAVPSDYPELDVRAVLGHMHLAGVALELGVERAAPEPEEPEEDCLLGIGAWDFDWQRLYWVDTDASPALRVRGGDTLQLRCVYDNPGQTDIVAGTASTDEMCVGTLFVTYEGEPIPNSSFESDG